MVLIRWQQGSAAEVTSRSCAAIGWLFEMRVGYRRLVAEQEGSGSLGRCQQLQHSCTVRSGVEDC
eukprot:COSAG02_NODE_292_length_25466_cov_5.070604_12_plen_65_part_00